MFRTLAFAKRKPGMTLEAFRTYYETHHAVLVAQLAPAPRRYRRNFIDFGNGENVNDELLDFDVVVELEFDDRKQYERWATAMSSPEAQERLAADMLNFTDQAKFRVCLVDVEP